MGLQSIPLHEFNPFTEATAGRYFVGREKQLGQFQQYLSGLKEKRPKHMYVAGTHGTGKTSYLGKLIEIATDSGFLGAMPTLNAGATAYDDIDVIMGSVVRAVQEHMKSKGNTRTQNILNDWYSGKNAAFFRHPHNEKVERNHIRLDLQFLDSLVKEMSIPGVVICIDEGQRINPDALSVLQNVLEHFDSYMVILSLRLIGEPGGEIAAGRAVLDSKSLEAQGDVVASHFLGTGVCIGPFDTKQEAANCMRRRLENNFIQFDDEVVDRIAWISGGTPREIINFASYVYNHASQKQIRLADSEAMKEVFRRVNHAILVEAKAMRDQMPKVVQAVLRSLLTHKRAMSAAEMIIHLYPTVPKELHSYIEKGIQNDLDRICDSSDLCRKIKDRYEIMDQRRAYALGLILGVK